MVNHLHLYLSAVETAAPVAVDRTAVAVLVAAAWNAFCTFSVLTLISFIVVSPMFKFLCLKIIN